MDRANLYLSMDVNENGTKALRRRKAGCNREWSSQAILLACHNHMLRLSRAVRYIPVWRLRWDCLQKSRCCRMV